MHRPKLKCLSFLGVGGERLPGYHRVMQVFFFFLLATHLLVSYIITADTPKDIFDLFEQEMLNARSQQAVLGLSEVFLERIEDHPKEIEITCPGNISPQVSIRDLVSSASSSSASAYDGGECMVLKLTGANFNFRLAVNCDEINRTDMRFSDKHDD